MAGRVLVDQGVEVAMAVGKSGRRTLLVGVGVGDSTEGRGGRNGIYAAFRGKHQGYCSQRITG
ncbi:MAG: hypothetical protein M5U34_02940 [Chloroflexi bacterium]|nr:hypothetical protein [Chloroflexota bacterium]